MRNLPASLRIESLESRIAPASLVTVTYAKGALGLTGDTGAHDFSITALDAVTIELKAATGTLFHMEGIADTDRILLTAPLKSLTATLGDANDHVSLIGLAVGGDVTINGGLGENEVEIDTLAAKGGLKITGGAGSDTVGISGGTFSVKKDFILELGDGTNEFDNQSLFQIGKNLTYTGGNAEDSFSSHIGSVTVGGNLSLVLGAGDADVEIGSTSVPSNLTVGKKFSVDSTASVDGDEISLSLGSFATRIGGDLEVKDGAGDLEFQTQTISSTGLRGKLSVETGAGESAIYFTMFQFFAKSVAIDAGASSASSVTIGGFTATFPAGITYTGGSGNDTVTIQGIGTNGSSLGGFLNANLGDGENSLQAVSVGGFFKTIKVVTGAGDDNLNVTALGAKTASIDIQTGAGTDTTQLLFLNSVISGKLSVANAATATQGKVSAGFLNTVVGSLDIALAGDDNQVTFGASLFTGFTSGLTIKKALHIATGAGKDTVNFLNATNVTVAGGVNLELGDGDNAVSGQPVNFVTKSFSVTGGTGADIVNFVLSGNLGAVTLNLGAGTNAATLAGGVSPLALKSLVFGSTSATGSTDLLSLARVMVSGKLDAKFGAGTSIVNVEDSTFGNTFNVETGAGADSVEIDNDGEYTGTLFAKAAIIKLGEDNDTLVLGGNGTSSLVTTKSTFTADGGAGTNTLTNTGNVFAKDPVFTGF